MADLQHSLATYVSDMLALEQHVCIPFAKQKSDADLQTYPQAAPLVARIEALSRAHVDALKQCLADLGGHEVSGAKTAVTNVEGWFASAIDSMRKTKVAKALRDDYTALALCSVSYSMLLATANAYGHAQVAALAEHHLRDYASAIMDIGQAMPAVVVRDLQETDIPITAGGAIEDSRERIVGAWRGGAQMQRQVSTGIIEERTAASPSFPVR
jgi:hypothetical protein